jgi:uncharacterized protein (DUF427 family)
MPKAIWNGQVLAQSDTFEEVEGNVYFPPGSLVREHLQASDHHTYCGWKGQASYYHVAVGGEINQNAAWFYPEPLEAAAKIKDHVAFWKGVTVER